MLYDTLKKILTPNPKALLSPNIIIESWNIEKQVLLIRAVNNSPGNSIEKFHEGGIVYLFLE